MTAVRKLPQAQEDLLDIWCHIACDNPRQADHYLDLLDDKLILLASTPRIGRSHDELEPGLRGFPVDNYLIFYRQVDAGIEIVRVLHGARDLEALFWDDCS
jgi:toxin ParE1/3/4